MARVRFFAQARDAAGVRDAEIGGATVGDVLTSAVAAYGEAFGSVLAVSAVWLNGEQADPGDPVAADDELAILPPVSGGGR